jgi:hypothetical protein
MYQTGNGVQRDYVQAHMRYNLSAARGWEPAVVGCLTLTFRRGRSGSLGGFRRQRSWYGQRLWIGQWCGVT